MFFSGICYFKSLEFFQLEVLHFFSFLLIFGFHFFYSVFSSQFTFHGLWHPYYMYFAFLSSMSVLCFSVYLVFPYVSWDRPSTCSFGCWAVLSWIHSAVQPTHVILNTVIFSKFVIFNWFLFITYSSFMSSISFLFYNMSYCYFV